MRTDNIKVKNTVILVYFLLFLLAVFITPVFKALHLFPDYIYKINLLVIGVLLLFYFMTSYFEYDSSGAYVSLLNRGLILTDTFNYREKKLDFERSQLLDFKIRNYLFYKTLTLSVKTNKNHIVKRRFNVSLVTLRKLGYIKQSLKKILKENKNA